MSRLGNRMLTGLVAGVAMIGVTPASAQVRVEWSAEVSRGGHGGLFVETWLAVSPVDARHMVATAMIPEEGASALWVSRDGGRGWTRAVEAGSGLDVLPGMDPVVEFAPNGVPYFATLADGFTVWQGKRDGDSWLRLGVVPGGSYDRQWIDFDASGGPRHGRMYTGGKVPVQVLGQRAQDIAAFSWLDDTGSAFVQPQLVLPDPSLGAMNVLSHMIVLPDGSLAAAFQFFPWEQTGMGGLIEGERQTMLSRDGRSWEGPFSAGPLRVFGNRGDQALMIKGLGGGRFATAESGPLYLTWVHEMNGFLQIVAVASNDGGRTWSEPVRVNEGGSNAHHSNPAIAVNTSGDVVVLWNDRRHDPTDRCFRAYVAVSRDGGRSFGPGTPLSEDSVCPPPGRWLNGGDTQGVVALPDGSFQALWIGADPALSGATRVMTSRVVVDP